MQLHVQQLMQNSTVAPAKPAVNQRPKVEVLQASTRAVCPKPFRIDSRTGSNVPGRLNTVGIFRQTPEGCEELSTSQQREGLAPHSDQRSGLQVPECLFKSIYEFAHEHCGVVLRTTWFQEHCA
jgi:hypothetical protein